MGTRVETDRGFWTRTLTAGGATAVPRWVRVPVPGTAGHETPVPDDVAATTMTRHHELLASGLPSDEALARAVVETDDVAAAFLNLGGQHRP